MVDVALVGGTAAAGRLAVFVAGLDVGFLLGGRPVVQAPFVEEPPVVGEAEPPHGDVPEPVGDLPGDVGDLRPVAGQLAGVFGQVHQRGQLDGHVHDAFTRCRTQRPGTTLGGGDGRVGPVEQVHEHVGPDLAGAAGIAVGAGTVGVAGLVGGRGDPA